MIVTLDTNELRVVMKTLKPFVNKNEPREALRWLQLEIRDDKCWIWAAYNYGLIRKEVKNFEGENGTMLIPLLDIPKAAYGETTLKQDGQFLNVNYGGQITEQHRRMDKEDWIDPHRVLPSEEPEYCLGVNPKYLKWACDALTQEKKPVKIELHGTLKPIVMRATDGSDDLAMTLPVNLKFKKGE
jgi:hypothetical protein